MYCYVKTYDVLFFNLTNLANLYRYFVHDPPPPLSTAPSHSLTSEAASSGVLLAESRSPPPPLWRGRCSKFSRARMAARHSFVIFTVDRFCSDSCAPTGRDYLDFGLISVGHDWARLKKPCHELATRGSMKSNDQWFWHNFILSMCDIKFVKANENFRPVYKKTV